MTQSVGRITFAPKYAGEERRRKLRINIYEVIDELNILDNKVWKRLHSKEVRDQFKKVRRMVNTIYP